MSFHRNIYKNRTRNSKWEESTMKVEVSCFVGGMVIKEIVDVDRFEDADQAAKTRNPFCTLVKSKVLMK